MSLTVLQEECKSTKIDDMRRDFEFIHVIVDLMHFGFITCLRQFMVSTYPFMTLHQIKFYKACLLHFKDHYIGFLGHQ